MAPDAEVIVVDNASVDDTVERARKWSETHPAVRVIANPENRGFAAAVNQGFRATQAESLLLLNPDVFLRSNIGCLVSASAAYGIAAGKLTDLAGHPQAGFTLRRLPTPAALIFEVLGINRLWPGNLVNRWYRVLDRNLSQAGMVEQPAGAFLMIRRDVWEKLGGLDERFHPLWFEDVDFCRRALAAGFQIQYEPAAVAAHEGGHSAARLTAGIRASYWYASLLKYGEKHFRPWVFRGLCAAVVLGSLPRMVLGMIAEWNLSPTRTYWKIMRFAGASLVKGRTEISR
mgnify:CR=1 FL=1